MLLHRATITTPIGDVLALATDSALCALEFGAKTRHDRLEARLRTWFPPHAIEDGETPLIARTRE